MALSEFVAMETAYRALQQLDLTARSRALTWLTDALNVPGVLPSVRVLEPSTVAAAPAVTAAVEASPAALPVTTAATAAVPPAKESAKESAGKKSRGAKRAAAVEAPRARRSRAAKAEPTGTERAYRRMPPVEDILAAYRQVGTISGLAEHYQVPRHTVQGWARRLREQGHEIGRNA